MASFVRLETFARHPTKQRRGMDASGPSQRTPGSAGAGTRVHTAADIVAEAERRPGHVPHIARPQPPRILHGTTPGRVLEEACVRADLATDRMGRRVKRDAAVLASAVTSYPLTWEDVRADPAGMRRIRTWLRAERKFWRGEFGDRVRCILLHVDEERPNVHVLLVPDLVPTTLGDGRTVQVLDVGSVDPLHRAAREAKAAGGSFAESRNAARLAGAAIGVSAGGGHAGPRVSRFEARVRREVHLRSAKLEAQLAEATAAARRGERALVVVAAERRRREATRTPAERGEAAQRRAAIRRVRDEVRRMAAARIPDTAVPRRLGEDGVVAAGGAPLRPGEPLRPLRERAHAIEQVRGLEAATARLARDLAVERDRADVAAAEAARRGLGAEEAHDAAERAEAARRAEAERARGLENRLRRTEAERDAAVRDRDAASASETAARTAAEEMRVVLEADRGRVAALEAAAAEAKAEAARLSVRMAEQAREDGVARARGEAALSVALRGREAAETERAAAAGRAAEAEAAARALTEERDEARRGLALLDAPLDRGKGVTRRGAAGEAATAASAGMAAARSAWEGRSFEPPPRSAPSGPPVAGDPVPGGAGTSGSAVLPAVRAVQAGLATLAQAASAVEEAAPGWRDRVLADAARIGKAPAAAAAALVTEFDEARRARPPLDAALRALDARMAELERPARGLARAAASAPGVPAPSLSEVVRRRGAVLEDLAWIPEPPTAAAGRHRRLATMLHPRHLLPAVPRAAFEEAATDRPGVGSAAWELHLSGQGMASPLAQPSGMGAASRPRR